MILLQNASRYFTTGILVTLSLFLPFGYPSSLTHPAEASNPPAPPHSPLRSPNRLLQEASDLSISQCTSRVVWFHTHPNPLPRSRK